MGKFGDLIKDSMDSFRQGDVTKAEPETSPVETPAAVEPETSPVVTPAAEVRKAAAEDLQDLYTEVRALSASPALDSMENLAEIVDDYLKISDDSPALEELADELESMVAQYAKAYAQADTRSSGKLISVARGSILDAIDEDMREAEDVAAMAISKQDGFTDQLQQTVESDHLAALDALEDNIRNDVEPRMVGTGDGESTLSSLKEHVFNYISGIGWDDASRLNDVFDQLDMAEKMFDEMWEEYINSRGRRVFDVSFWEWQEAADLAEETIGAVLSAVEQERQRLGAAGGVMEPPADGGDLPNGDEEMMMQKQDDDERDLTRDLAELSETIEHALIDADYEDMAEAANEIVSWVSGYVFTSDDPESFLFELEDDLRTDAEQYRVLYDEVMEDLLGDGIDEDDLEAYAEDNYDLHFALKYMAEKVRDAIAKEEERLSGEPMEKATDYHAVELAWTQLNAEFNYVTDKVMYWIEEQEISDDFTERDKELALDDVSALADLVYRVSETVEDRHERADRTLDHTLLYEVQGDLDSITTNFPDAINERFEQDFRGLEQKLDQVADLVEQWFNETSGDMQKAEGDVQAEIASLQELQRQADGLPQWAYHEVFQALRTLVSHHLQSFASERIASVESYIDEYYERFLDAYDRLAERAAENTAYPSYDEESGDYESEDEWLDTMMQVEADEIREGLSENRDLMEIVRNAKREITDAVEEELQDIEADMEDDDMQKSISDHPLIVEAEGYTIGSYAEDTVDNITILLREYLAKVDSPTLEALMPALRDYDTQYREMFAREWEDALEESGATDDDLDPAYDYVDSSMELLRFLVDVVWRDVKDALLDDGVDDLEPAPVASWMQKADTLTELKNRFLETLWEFGVEEGVPIAVNEVLAPYQYDTGSVAIDSLIRQSMDEWSRIPNPSDPGFGDVDRIVDEIEGVISSLVDELFEDAQDEEDDMQKAGFRSYSEFMEAVDNVPPWPEEYSVQQLVDMVSQFIHDAGESPNLENLTLDEDIQAYASEYENALEFADGDYDIVMDDRELYQQLAFVRQEILDAAKADSGLPGSSTRTMKSTDPSEERSRIKRLPHGDLYIGFRRTPGPAGHLEPAYPMVDDEEERRNARGRTQKSADLHNVFRMQKNTILAALDVLDENVDALGDHEQVLDMALTKMAGGAPASRAPSMLDDEPFDDGRSISSLKGAPISMRKAQQAPSMEDNDDFFEGAEYLQKNAGGEGLMNKVADKATTGVRLGPVHRQGYARWLSVIGVRRCDHATHQAADSAVP